MHIREATEADWPHIWPFMRQIIAAGETYTYDRATPEDTAKAMWLLRAPGHTVVAVNESGEILGTAKMNPNHQGGSSHIASASFMVDPTHSGQGTGRKLGEYVLSWARNEGYRAMQFNAVVETNTAAVALWKSLGFEVMTTLPEGFQHPVHGFVGLHIMYLRFPPSPASVES